MDDPDKNVAQNFDRIFYCIADRLAFVLQFIFIGHFLANGDRNRRKSCCIGEIVDASLQLVDFRANVGDLIVDIQHILSRFGGFHDLQQLALSSFQATDSATDVSVFFSHIVASDAL